MQVMRSEITLSLLNYFRKNKLETVGLFSVGIGLG